ncbi:uncharacterized protein [Acropora muricata]|uniref:uncharacterized protein isoform X2 n=1 Tax=Acropora muricata TaxID=159855 RepID=UPI0034E3757B
MAIIYQGIILLFVFSLAIAQTSPPNPECRGMNTAAKHLESGIKSLTILAGLGSAKCNPTKHCSGVICRWSSNSILEVDLNYCKDPVNYHVYLKDPRLKNRNISIGEKDEQVLFKTDTMTAKIKVTKLNRSGNTVITSVVLDMCPTILGITKGCYRRPLLPRQTICVRMDKCSGFNASVDHYKPCSYTSTPSTFISSSHWPVPTTEPPFPFRSSSAGPHPHFPGKGPSTGHWPVPTTEPPFPFRSSSADPYAQGYSREDKDKSSKDLSTGAIIGICAAGLFVILIVIGAAVYWKKYHRRTRLRAAYYNDISMHDPLCGEDFGPEVA